jgi:hypothetical protein
VEANAAGKNFFERRRGPYSLNSREYVKARGCLHLGGSPNGLFSVRSAYYLHKAMEKRGMAGSSSNMGTSTVWKDIWRLRLPNVEKKKFLWRACHDILPTKQNLCRRKIVENPWCPICKNEVETAVHALWGCPSARDVCTLVQRAKDALDEFLAVSPYTTVMLHLPVSHGV